MGTVHEDFCRKGRQNRNVVDVRCGQCRTGSDPSPRPVRCLSRCQSGGQYGHYFQHGGFDYFARMVLFLSQSTAAAASQAGSGTCLPTVIMDGRISHLHPEMEFLCGPAALTSLAGIDWKSEFTLGLIPRWIIRVPF